MEMGIVEHDQRHLFKLALTWCVTFPCALPDFQEDHDCRLTPSGEGEGDPKQARVLNFSANTQYLRLACVPLSAASNVRSCK